MLCGVNASCDGVASDWQAYTCQHWYVRIVKCAVITCATRLQYTAHLRWGTTIRKVCVSEYEKFWFWNTFDVARYHHRIFAFRRIGMLPVALCVAWVCGAAEFWSVAAVFWESAPVGWCDDGDVVLFCRSNQHLVHMYVGHFQYGDAAGYHRYGFFGWNTVADK